MYFGVSARYTTRVGIYCPQRSCGKAMFLHLSVSHSVNRRRVSGRHIPPGRHPRADTTPPSRQLLQRTVRILLECILVYSKNTIFTQLRFTQPNSTKFHQRLKCTSRRVRGGMHFNEYALKL